MDSILSDIYKEENFAFDELLLAIEQRAKASDPYLQAILMEKGVRQYLLGILEAIFQDQDITVIQKRLLQFDRNNPQYQSTVTELYEHVKLLYASDSERE